MPVGQNFLSQLKKVRVNKKTITRSIRDLMTDFQSAKYSYSSIIRCSIFAK